MRPPWGSLHFLWTSVFKNVELLCLGFFVWQCSCTKDEPLQIDNDSVYWLYY